MGASIIKLIDDDTFIKAEKVDLIKSVNNAGLSLQEGGRVINLCDKISKSQAMRHVVKIFKKINMREAYQYRNQKINVNPIYCH